MEPELTRHPAGIEARILLCSVFGPYARDDEWGSRAILPMEAYHNQITRVQGPFSMRMFHRSFGLMMIKENIDAPCTLLDFPNLERFTREIRDVEYDIIGISAVPSNVLKVKEMCRLIRQYQPEAVIVIGSHVSNIDNIDELVDADFFVTGDGIRWMREYLGQCVDAPVKHPHVTVGFDIRSMGFKLLNRPGIAAMLIPAVGCPVGCNFCSTSAMFGGKGKFVNFYETGEELFQVMCDIEKSLKVRDFFIQDENFLLQKKRTLRLLELMEEHDKSWSLFVFSSADVLQLYTVDQLVRLGVVWVWLGLEAKDSGYAKLEGIDTQKLVRELQDHGIMFVASTMLGLETHTNENIDELIDWAVAHDTDFHQFMLYHAIAGTPLYKELDAEGRLPSEEEMPWPDFHGMTRFNYRHWNIKNGEEEAYILGAFQKDFETNGPSIARTVRTILKGWLKHKDHPDLRVRRRFQWWSRYMSTLHAAGIWAIRKWYRKDARLWKKMDDLLQDIYREFGWKPRLFAPLAGPIIYWKLRNEDRRLARGKTYEPRVFYEKNKAARHTWSMPPQSRRYCCPKR